MTLARLTGRDLLSSELEDEAMIRRVVAEMEPSLAGFRLRRWKKTERSSAVLGTTLFLSSGDATALYRLASPRPAEANRRHLATLERARKDASAMLKHESHHVATGEARVGWLVSAAALVMAILFATVATFSALAATRTEAASAGLLLALLGNIVGAYRH